MCDFRGPPDYVINPYTNQPSGYSYNGIVDICESIRFGDRKVKSEVKEDGVYYICATGSNYNFYLNDKWWGYDYMVWKNDDCCCHLTEGNIIEVESGEFNPYFDYKPFYEKIWFPAP